MTDQRVFHAIKVSLEGKVATVELARPGKSNALNDDMWQEIPQVCPDASQDPCTACWAGRLSFSTAGISGPGCFRRCSSSEATRVLESFVFSKCPAAKSPDCRWSCAAKAKTSVRALIWPTFLPCLQRRAALPALGGSARPSAGTSDSCKMPSQPLSSAGGL